MATIKFDLPINGTKVRNVDELKENLSAEIIPVARSGQLGRWFLSRQLQAFADPLAIAVEEHPDDVDLFMAICRILDIDAHRDDVAALFSPNSEMSENLESERGLDPEILRDAGTSRAAFPRWSVGTINPTQVTVNPFTDKESLIEAVMREIVILAPETQEALKQYMEAMTEEACLQLAGDALESVMSRVFSDPAQRMELVKGNIDTQALTVNEAISLLLSRVMAGKKRTFSSLEEIMESKESLRTFVNDRSNDISVLPGRLFALATIIRDIKGSGCFIDTESYLTSIMEDMESFYDLWHQHGLAGVVE